MSPRAKSPQSSLAELSALIGTIYDAAIKGASLDPMLADICRMTQSNAGALLLFDRSHGNPSGLVQGVPSWLASYHYSEAARNAYDTYYNAIHPAMEPSARVIQTGGIYHITDFMREAEYRNTEYYTDFQCKYGICNGNGIVLEHSVNRTIVGWFSADPAIGKTFPPEHRAAFELITPHLQRALTIWSEMRSLHQEQAVSFGALDYLKTGVVVLNDEGAVMFVNAAAESICSSCKGLRLTNRHVSATAHPVNKELQSIIQGILLGGGDADSLPGGMVSIPAQDGGHGVLAVCIPVAEGYDHVLGAHPRVMIFLRDPNVRLGASAESLQNVYGLSPTEALVVLGIAEGKTVADCALQLGHSIHTSRNLLKRAFSKTETHGQAELTALLLKTLPP